MGNSLQDQLLKAGLVDKGKAQKAKKLKQKRTKQQRNAKGKTLSAQELQRQQELAALRERDRELNLKRHEVRQQREIAAQVKQLVDNNRHPRCEGENCIPFHFESKGKIKRLYVSEATQKMLADGRLVIVNNNGQFDLVPPEIAEKVRTRNPALVIDLPKEEASAEDDPYADYQVPDDLMW